MKSCSLTIFCCIKNSVVIDPPYNTGSDFVYKDNYKDSLANYKNIVSSTGKSNPETSGRFHTDWLNMMFPRLMLAHTLLKEDGVIFISIDDNEVDNLKKMCNEIFGENNFIACVVWERAFAPVNLKKHFSESHDYILVYAKNINELVCNGLKRNDEANNRYSNPDNDHRGVWTSGDFSVGPAVESNIYKIVTPSGRECYPPNGRSWRVSEEKFKEMVADNRVWFGEDGNNTPRQKRFLSEVKNSITPMTIWKYGEVGHTQDATKKLKELFDNIHTFDYSKTVDLIKRCIELYTENDSIILDFFSGSATTAHAVMQLNAEDGGNRKYIMVQLPQLCDEKTEAYKNGYKNICEIGKERIRRAGAKIKEEMENTENLDTGFRVFKLDSTNFNRWNVPLFEDIDINEYLNNAKEIVDDRTEVDAMFEILIKNGFPLTEKIYSLDVDNYKFYHIGEDCLVLVSFEKNIPIDVIEQAIEYVPAKLILTMDAFEDTSAMVTAKHIINKDYSIQFEILGEN